ARGCFWRTFPLVAAVPPGLPALLFGPLGVAALNQLSPFAPAGPPPLVFPCASGLVHFFLDTRALGGVLEALDLFLRAAFAHPNGEACVQAIGGASVGIDGSGDIQAAGARSFDPLEYLRHLRPVFCVIRFH